MKGINKWDMIQFVFGQAALVAVCKKTVGGSGAKISGEQTSWGAASLHMQYVLV